MRKNAKERTQSHPLEHGTRELARVTMPPPYSPPATLSGLMLATRPERRPYTSPDRVIRGRRKGYAAPSRAPAACWPADDTAPITVNDGDASGLRSPMTTWRCAVTGLRHMGEGLVH